MVHLYRLLWVSTVLNVLGLCLGIITAAILGAFKDMVSGVFLCVSSRSALSQSSGPSPSRGLNGSLDRGGPKLPSDLHVTWQLGLPITGSGNVS